MQAELTNIYLKSFQQRFVLSKKRYPAMISAWGTGKTLCLIMRALKYSEDIPFNLGVIFRKEFVDLRDSTLKDFEQFTGLKVDSQRNVKFDNGSIIMFRHTEELNSIQNMNLGWFGIEQAEELPSEDIFFKLWGRLRRQLTPTYEFNKFELPIHSGFVIGNVAGANWVKALWKDKLKDDFELIEAVTTDNADVLPIDYMKNLELLKDLQPDLYKRFVLNDWGVETQGKVFKSIYVDQCIEGGFEEPIKGINYVMGVDLAKYQDFTVLTTMRTDNKHIVNYKRFNETSWSLQKAEIAEIARQYNNALIVPDATGVGDPIVEDLQRAGLDIYRDLSKSRDGFVIGNTSKEQLIENLIIGIEHKKLTYPKIDVLIDELKDFEIEITKAGNTHYSAPEGRHDDTVISLALAYWGIERNSTPEIMFL